MAMELLRTASLADVRDGMLAHQLDGELVKVHADCVDRPNLKKARTITLSITFTPVGDDPLDGVDVEFSVKTSLPPATIARQMKSYARRNGFAFDTDTDSISHDVRQRRLDGIDDDEE